MTARCHTAVVLIWLIWQIFLGAAQWFDIVNCLQTVLSPTRISAWAMAVYFINR